MTTYYGYEVTKEQREWLKARMFPYHYGGISDRVGAARRPFTPEELQERADELIHIMRHQPNYGISTTIQAKMVDAINKGLLKHSKILQKCEEAGLTVIGDEILVQSDDEQTILNIIIEEVDE